jgi:hypothetical protein
MVEAEHTGEVADGSGSSLRCVSELWQCEGSVGNTAWIRGGSPNRARKTVTYVVHAPQQRASGQPRVGTRY